MKVLYLSFFIFLFSYSTNAQDVQWASRVLGYSSEYRPGPYGTEYRAIQILGRPDKLPDVGSSPCAWSPAQPNTIGEEWIKVGFEKTIPLRQVAIAENFNAGAIARVFAYTADGQEILLIENSITPTKEIGKMTYIFPSDSSLQTNAIKIVLQPSRVVGYNQIDAIGISSSTVPIKPTIFVSADAPKNLQKENLGKTVNSKGQEVAPVISPDGKLLFFTRSKFEGNIGSPNRQDVWVSSLDNSNVWSEAINLKAPINNDGDNAITGISPDGKTIYLINVYKPDGSMINGLSKSVRTRNGWSFPKECKIKNHYNDHPKNFTEFAISPKGKVLVLSVQRKDTEGNKDLYVSFLQPDDTWSEPKHMGNAINTPDYEGSPFIASDDKSLYFTSAGFSGFGNGDIFVSRRLDDTWTNWTEPENLGPSINTAQWDGYFNIPASADYAYLSSMENSMGEEDIFRVRLFPSIKPDPVAIISGNVLDAETNQMIDAEISADIKNTNEEFAKANFEPETGEFKMILPLKELYRITASHPGYFPVTEEVDLSRETNFRLIRKNILMLPIKEGQKIRLNQIMFEQSSAEVISSSLPEMGRIIQMMKEYPAMEILLEGHTDNVGDWQKNLKLSEDRVVEVRRYLATQGIENSRIQTKAWGPAKPISSNLTEQTRKWNRRVEFTILKL
ncbi:OmpA family protein [Arundinibacter roseus]|uniref:Flagellar motor protein MotB n=1 Tax=Arundinibacter roseus TaxID=2070510 RepID=A0A4R4KCC7_9BACT|nr:OmpA family protein [Arundinibacter roseus]TDB64432.1 flagellar motor protein MotB [Arundinibacter roseus]